MARWSAEGGGLATGPADASPTSPSRHPDHLASPLPSIDPPWTPTFPTHPSSSRLSNRQLTTFPAARSRHSSVTERLQAILSARLLRETSQDTAGMWATPTLEDLQHLTP